MERDDGSFRDRDARVFYRDGAILRGLSPEGLRDWQALSRTAFFKRLTAEGRLVPTEQIQDGEAAERWAAVLKHEKIPFISYPYEWCFGMLRQAALLQLELLKAALEEGFIVKDATPFNIQWKGVAPVFIDIASFQRMEAGEPWAGYRQFCRLFLYPLMLQAYKRVAYHPWLRGSLEGIDPEDLSRLFTLRDRLRPGVFSHVYLQARLQERYGQAAQGIKDELKAAGFNSSLIRANVGRLERLLRRLRWEASPTIWSDYATQNSYAESDRSRKMEFVGKIAGTRRWRLVWDLGCNTGAFSRLVAEHADYLVAFDSDQAVIERFYRSLLLEGRKDILPLVTDLADPSPALGWRGAERKTLPQRGRPELVLCLALIHHVVIGSNVPMSDFIDWLAGLGGDLVIEFVSKEDPMVKRLLGNKTDKYDDYSREELEACLSRGFHLAPGETLACGTRTLYYARTRSRTSVAGRS